jgi:predicted RNA-binding Zn-ribbon protein involved in translation (DUF1610 family)
MPSSSQARFRLCPVCTRAVPIESQEHYCINDGARMLERCPKCQAGIHSPYTRHCSSCGFDFHTASSFESHASTPSTPLEAQPLPRNAPRAEPRSPSSQRFSRRRSFAVGAILTLALVGVSLFWSSTRQSEMRGVYIGRIPGSEALIAIATHQGRALAYVCDGKRVTTWFTGKLKDHHALELHAKDGSTLVADLEAHAARGALELPSGSYAFAALPARAKAGLYRAEGANQTVGGWIVLPNGEQRAVIASPNGIATAPPLEATSRLEALGLQNVLPVNPDLENSFEF